MKFILRVLLIAGPFFLLQSAAPGQTRRVRAAAADPAKLLELQLTESFDDLKKLFGEPAQTNDLGAAYVVWDYKIDVEDNHEFSHTFCFNKASGTLVSATRKWDRDRKVDPLLPPAETNPHYYPNAEQPQYGVRARMLTGDRVLIAMGAPKPGDPTSQLILIRRDAVKTFFTWLDPHLPASGPSEPAAAKKTKKR